jgi:hypothetical protein
MATTLILDGLRMALWTLRAGADVELARHSVRERQ